MTSSKPCTISNSGELIQQVWGGYGDVRRVSCTHSISPPRTTSVVKTIRLPPLQSQEYASTSFQRKLSSYMNEVTFYSQVLTGISQRLCVPAFLDASVTDTCIQLVLTDLREDGYVQHPSGLRGALSCLNWLARFHAAFMVDRHGADCRHTSVHKLWAAGTYWFLGTRRDEFDALEPDSPLRLFAQALDDCLSSSRFYCLVHGDAKFSNFLLNKSGEAAAVDFQYVGHACGMKDVAYLIDDLCSSSNAQPVTSALDAYFGTLRRELLQQGWEATRLDELERSWRDLFPVAVADFARFYCGWAGVHFSHLSKGLRDIVAQGLQVVADWQKEASPKGS